MLFAAYRARVQGPLDFRGTQCTQYTYLALQHAFPFRAQSHPSHPGGRVSVIQNNINILKISLFSHKFYVTSIIN